MKKTVINTLEDQFEEQSQVLTTLVKQDLQKHSDRVTASLTQQDGKQTRRLDNMEDRLTETTKAIERLQDEVQCQMSNITEVQGTLASRVEECITRQETDASVRGNSRLHQRYLNTLFIRV